MSEEKAPPVIALVGRPNVGKSTLFNRLTGRRESLVHETAHTTRDVKSGQWDMGNLNGYVLFDTCGLGSSDSIAVQDAQKKSLLLLQEAAVLILIVSALDGWTSGDTELLEMIRKSGTPYIVVASKHDRPDRPLTDASFYEPGEDILGLSGLHGVGLLVLEDKIAALVQPQPLPEYDESKKTTLAVVGRPNTGKSTLFNRLLGEARSVVSTEAGTTVDVIEEDLVVGGIVCNLIDTAGARRQVRVRESLEQSAVRLALEAIRRCHYVVMLLDAEEGVTHQDIRIMQYAWERQRCLLLVANRIDLAPKGEDWKKNIATDIDRIIPQLNDVPLVAASALTGRRADRILPILEKMIEQSRRKIRTREINQWLERLQVEHAPRLLNTGGRRQRRRPKFFYAVQVRQEPITIRVYCNFPGALEDGYQRFMLRSFRKVFALDLVPVAFQYQRGRAENKGK